MKNYRIYKPNKTNNGAASQFQLSYKKDKKFDNVMLFLEVTKQTGVDDNGNAKFGWDDPSKKITMKLEETDIGEILAVLNWQKPMAGTDKGIFHKSAKGNTVLSFSRVEKDGKCLGLGIRVSRKLDGETEATIIQHMISIGEGEVLKVLLQNALSAIYNW